MCPLCWTTALTFFTFVISLTTVTLVGTDRGVQFVIAGLAIAGALQKLGIAAVPWWLWAFGCLVLLLRAGWVCWQAPQDQLIVKAWHKALLVTKASCPYRYTKTTKNE